MQFPNRKLLNINIISNDHEINLIKIQVSQFAPISGSKTVFLVLGERGTGKGLIAKAFHEASECEGAFVKVDCGTKNESLFESALFGHLKGAFTGADSDKNGAFETAGRGTVFFDEIGNLDKRMQDIMLTPLEERKFQKVGSSKMLDIYCMIVCATNANLAEMIKLGQFRADLFDRINKIPILIPPLRKRKQDIPLLIHHFMHKYFAEFTKNSDDINAINDPIGIENDAIDILMKFDWPGNVRQLENAIYGIVLKKAASGEKKKITFQDLPEEIVNPQSKGPFTKFRKKPLPGNTKFTDEDLIYWMQKFKGTKNFNARAAKELGVDPKTVWLRWKNIDPKFK